MDLNDYGVELSDDVRNTLARLHQPFPISDAMRQALTISDSMRKAFEAVGLLSCSIGETASSLIGEQYEHIGKTATDAAQNALRAAAVPSALQTMMDELTVRTERAAKLLPDFTERPQPVIHNLPSLMPSPHRQTPAAETIKAIVEMWEQRRCEIQGTSQDAFVKITAPDG